MTEIQAVAKAARRLQTEDEGNTLEEVEVAHRQALRLLAPAGRLALHQGMEETHEEAARAALVTHEELNGRLRRHQELGSEAGIGNTSTGIMLDLQLIQIARKHTVWQGLI